MNDTCYMPKVPSRSLYAVFKQKQIGNIAETNRKYNGNGEATKWRQNGNEEETKWLQTGNEMETYFRFVAASFPLCSLFVNFRDSAAGYCVCLF